MLFSPDLIIAFDPGTKLGWSIFEKSGDDTYKMTASGMLDMSGKVWGDRFDTAAEFVHTTIETTRKPLEKVAVVYENIQARTLRSYDNLRVTTGIITAVYQGAYRANVEQYEIFPVPLMSVKLHATGNGRASKKEMRDAFTERYGRTPVSDDEADAAHMGSYCAEVLADRVKRPNTTVWAKLSAHYEGTGKPSPKKRSPRKKKPTKKSRPAKGSSGGKASRKKK